MTHVIDWGPDSPTEMEERGWEILPVAIAGIRCGRRQITLASCRIGAGRRATTLTTVEAISIWISTAEGVL